MSVAFVICPDQRLPLSEILPDAPLVLQSYLGKPLIDHAMTGLAVQGYRRVVVYASDRPTEIRAYLLHAAAWGLDFAFEISAQEKTIQQVREDQMLDDVRDIFLLDCLPQAPDVPILSDARSWHRSRETLLPLLVKGQVGVTEHAPGVWRGLRSRIGDRAVIEAPAWIGHHAIIHEDARVGPHSYVENHAMVDQHAEVIDSTVGMNTYVGQMTRLAQSWACGGTLVNWSNGSMVRVVDQFLLSTLEHTRRSASTLLGRMLALIVLFITSPFILLVLLFRFLLGKRSWEKHQAVTAAMPGGEMRVVNYAKLPGLPGPWSRWPCLWRIVTGDFSWVGNPPLSPSQLEELTQEFERLWIQAPPAIFTAPEAEGACEPWDDEAKLHAAMYATQANRSWRMRILRVGLCSLFFTKQPSK